MIRRLQAFYLAGLMLLTQVGIPVVTHVCRGQEKASVSPWVPFKSCCAKSVFTHQRPPIHPSDTACAAASIQKKPCCETHTQVLKMKADLTPAAESPVLKMVSVTPWPPLVYTSPFHLLTAGENAPLTFQPHAPPVPLYGRSLLIFEQNFRC